MNVTISLIERLQSFEISHFSFCEKLESYINRVMDWKDVSLLYIESVAQMHDIQRGVQVGAIHFIEELRHTQNHYLWFGLITRNIQEFSTLCQQFDLVSNREPSYLYEYYMHIHRMDDEFKNVHPELKAQFDPSLSGYSGRSFEEVNMIQDPVIPKDGEIVYFWSPPSRVF